MKEPEWQYNKKTGECPVPEGHNVELMFADSTVLRVSDPETHFWGHAFENTITYYRDWTTFEYENYEKVLKHEFTSMDFCDPITIKGYLRKLLTALWNEGEGFNSKRPFGNSGWELELYQALVECGAVEGEICEGGYLESFDKKQANKLIFDLIDYTFGV